MKSITLPKTNMDTQNDGKGNSLQTWQFSVSMLDFWGVHVSNCACFSWCCAAQKFFYQKKPERMCTSPRLSLIVELWFSSKCRDLARIDSDEQLQLGCPGKEVDGSMVVINGLFHLLLNG